MAQKDLLRAIEEHVDPNEFDGTKATCCFVGQVMLGTGLATKTLGSNTLRFPEPGFPPMRLEEIYAITAEKYDVPDALIQRIFADSYNYGTNYDGAMEELIQPLFAEAQEGHLVAVS